MKSSIAKVLEELKLSGKFDKLEALKAEIAIARNANSLFSSRLVEAGRQCWAKKKKKRERESFES